METTKGNGGVRRATGGIVAATVLGVCAPTAHAQSSVTLYGILSEGIAYASNTGGKSNVQLLAGTMQNNRFGLRGTEDLGGGLKAIFTLENGFDITSGKLQQGGRMFGRQAFGGLSSTVWGTITAGRQYATPTDFLQILEAPVAAAGYAVHVGDNDEIFSSYRYNNSLKYQTPVFAGLRGEVMYAMSNDPGRWALNRSLSAGVGYDNAGLKLAAVYLNTDNPGVGGNPNGAVTDDYSGAPFVLFRSSPLNANVGVARQREYGAGAQYQFSTVRISGIVTDVRYDYLDHTSLHLDNVDVNASYFIRPELMLSAAYVYTSGKYGGFNRAPHWNMGQLSLDYFLSKRTDVYLFADYQKATGATADIYAFSPSSNSSQTVVVAGIRHKF
ncbi:porin [Paraburkholderia nemoris]